jgi:O-antigen/teichoic acid export membrane protein
LLGRKSLLVFIGSLVSSALGFVCLFFITNFVGVEAYGQVILMVSILTTINVVADLGFSSAHIKRISEGCDVDDCISTFVLIKVNLICVFVLLSFGALLVWSNFLGGEMTAETRDVFLVMMLFEVCINLASIALVTFQGESQIAKVQLLLILNPKARSRW